MCGRYYVDDSMIREIEKIVHTISFGNTAPGKRDVAPSMDALVLTGKQETLTAESMKWGFPQYDRKGLLINARSETACEKRTFRDSVLHRRCVIPAKKFYEWDSSKNKVTFYRSDASLLYLAGFYRKYQDGERFIILTTGANPSMAPVHDRMPLILEERELTDWVYDDQLLPYFLQKTPPLLGRSQEYEQQTLPFL